MLTVQESSSAVRPRRGNASSVTRSSSKLLLRTQLLSIQYTEYIMLLSTLEIKNCLSEDFIFFRIEKMIFRIYTPTWSIPKPFKKITRYCLLVWFLILTGCNGMILTFWPSIHPCSVISLQCIPSSLSIREAINLRKKSWEGGGWCHFSFIMIKMIQFFKKCKESFKCLEFHISWVQFFSFFFIF